MGNPNSKPCPFCRELIARGARKCKHCGEFLDPVLRHSPTVLANASDLSYPRWSPGVAAVLSLIIPGAGQMYKGKVITGLTWMIIVGIGYLVFVIPGLFFHLLCILFATGGDPTK